MENSLNTVLDAVDEDKVEIILHALDLLDEHYSKELDYNKVLETRSLKDTIRKHVPKHLIN
tara:strand:- start:380 stop:562 length:183 start_codon:yes stop_codon:yes gene_type:complete